MHDEQIQTARILSPAFFDRDAQEVACELLGKILCHKMNNIWLKAMIIETEAYYINEKASHASLGWTPKRHALFMEPGTIYMYYARGGDSLNISCRGEGNAVLCKAGVPYPLDDERMINIMRQLNPLPQGGQRKATKLCAGQTLLCRALHLKVKDWDQQPFNNDKLRFEDVGHRPQSIIQTTRMGIPEGRDAHLPYRFIDQSNVRSCTKNPLTAKYEQPISFISH